MKYYIIILSKIKTIETYLTNTLIPQTSTTTNYLGITIDTDYY